MPAAVVVSVVAFSGAATLKTAMPVVVGSWWLGVGVVARGQFQWPGASRQVPVRIKAPSARGGKREWPGHRARATND